MYMEDKINKIPQNFIKNSLYLLNDLMFFTKDVNMPAKTMITPCPKEKANNNKEAYKISEDKLAKLIIEAKIGVEQGVAASAKNIPKTKG